MQHSVGFTFNRATHWAELTDFGAVLTNTTLVVAFVHMSTAAFPTAGVFSAGSWSCRRPQM